MELLTVINRQVTSMRTRGLTPAHWILGNVVLHHLMQQHSALFLFGDCLEPTILGYPFQLDLDNPERLELVVAETPDADRLIKQALGEA